MSIIRKLPKELSHVTRKAGRDYQPTFTQILASEAIINQAYAWLCKKRKNSSHNNDVWFLRRDWHKLKPWLQQQLLQGTYRFKPALRYKVDGEILDCWSAMDSLVLKCLALVLSEHIPETIKTHCYHLKGKGGTHGAVRIVKEQLPEYKFFCRTDVQEYYANINHKILWRMLKRRFKEKHIRRLLWHYIKSTTEIGGTFKDRHQGIGRGCPLASVISALYLEALDEEMGKDKNIEYVRYMDDWVILTKTRKHLRKAIATMNKVLESLCLWKHPDKTEMGKIDKGFDFLGFHITRSKMGMARESIKRLRACLISLL